MKKIIFLLLLFPCIATFHENPIGEQNWLPNLFGILWVAALYSFYTYTKFGKTIIKDLTR